MMFARRIARPLLASYFIYRGARLLRRPEEGLEAAERATITAANASKNNPRFTPDPWMLVRTIGIVNVVFGAILGFSRCHRPAAMVLVGTAIPAALASHPYWEQADPQLREEERQALLAELSMTGGLLLASVDTGGKPSLAWRTKHAAQLGKRSTQRAFKAQRHHVAGASKSVRAGVKTGTRKTAKATAATTGGIAKKVRGWFGR